MIGFLARRLAVIVPTLFFVSVIIFGLQQLLPGDPASALAGEDRDPNVIAFIRAKLPVTAELAGLAMMFALLIGIPAGILSAVRNNTAWDYAANLFALWG